MRSASWLAAGLFGALNLIRAVNAEDLFEAHALSTCANDSIVSINRFDVTYTPSNNNIVLGFTGSFSESASTNVLIDIDVLIYGYNAISLTMNPCASPKISFLCPMQSASLNIQETSLSLDSDALKSIPKIAYTVPDIDAVVRLKLKDASTNASITCIETRVYNGKTVNQEAVAWVLAVITGLGMVATMVVSILGYSNIATHMAFRTLLFLGWMQSMAMWGMTSVTQPPIVQSWTQMFQWSMGIIRVGFLQTICTWFLRATGGTAQQILTEVAADEVSVVPLKRSLDSLTRRSSLTTSTGSEITVRGIERMAYRANIASTNIFMTGYLFFYFIAIVVIIAVSFLGLTLPRLMKNTKNPKWDRALSVTANWKDYLRGALYRLAWIGYPQMCVLCMWELYHHDSAAEIVLAICMWLVMSAVLGFATFKVWQRARVARALKQNPAYSLYSDPACLTKWGFIYTNFKATSYYFIFPLLAYIIIKGMVIAFGQGAPLAQSIVLLIVEALFMIATCVLRPYMDRPANGLCITVSVLNFINSIFILVFTDVFDQPALMTGIMGVLFALYNALFMLALLIFLLIGFFYCIVLREPRAKYQPLADNRDSFRMSENRLTTELLPLEKAAQSDLNTENSSRDEIIETPPPTHPHGDLRPPRSPFADPVEPTLPLIPSSSSASVRSRQSTRSGRSGTGGANAKFAPNRFENDHAA
ncbi:TRP-like family [Penicillium sp. IBT 18751x]|nr:TRP-like family [Penicillium sp. IBT 18751x]